MHAFDVLGDPVRRRVVELLSDGESTAGSLAERIGAEFGITQPAVSAHLRVLRESGFATVSADGTRRIYAAATGPLDEIDAWLSRYHRRWTHALDALETEVARGRPGRRDRTRS